MIQKIADKYDGYPGFLTDLYYDEYKDSLGDITEEQFWWGMCCADRPFIGEELANKVDEWCCDKWKEILRGLAHLFQNSLEETCSMANPYEEEYQKAKKEHRAKYPGVYGYGEDVPGNPEAHPTPNGGTTLSEKSPYTMWNLPEYKEIYEKQEKAQKELESTLKQNREKALRLFAKYLPYLAL